jgi:hypothetical protein
MTHHSLNLRFTLIAAFVALVASALAQQTVTPSSTTASTSVVPQLVNYSGTLTDLNGKPLSSIVGVTFSLYQEAQSLSPLWIETQSVQPDKSGHYTAILGSTTSTGLPQDVFVSGEARWLGVRPEGQAEQPRVLLVAVPYALKAGDAQTIGGLPPSAFVLAAPPVAPSTAAQTQPALVTSSAVPPPPNSAVTGLGTVGTIPLWDTTSDIVNSLLTQSGTGITAKIAVNGILSLPNTGTATSTAGFNSEPLSLVASAFNSTSSAAVKQSFNWQAEPAANNTSAPSGTLNLLFGAGATKPAETGLKIASNGLLTFATGQTFPGTGNGTITGITTASGSGLSGGGTTGTLNLEIPSAGVTNAMLQHSSLTLTPGSGLIGAGAMSLGGSYALNIDATKIPRLAAANSFTNNQTMTVSTNGFPTLTVVNTDNGDGIDITTVDSVGDTGMFISDGWEGLYSSGDSVGVYGVAAGPFPLGLGVAGFTGTAQGVGTWGQAMAQSITGVLNGQVLPTGIWGDTSAEGFGVLGTTDDGFSVAGINNSTVFETAFFENTETTNKTASILEVFSGVGGSCSIDASGDLNCTGTITPVVPVAGGQRKVGLNAINSPENWFEDAGSAQLSNGEAVVNLEPLFGETVNTAAQYHVFLTPSGDCKGLYVAQKSPSSFVVRELGGGTSSIAFDYRIMAKRKGFEQVRLVEKKVPVDRAAFLARNRNPHQPFPKPLDAIKLIEQKHHQRIAQLTGPVPTN